MKYTNPIVKGFYPDPSVCEANGKYYLVCSSFQYFPGVPLFESEDLVNWKQIGHVLTRKTQVMLEKINSSGGVFAPTIRYNDGRFYMVTTNDTTHQHFYVYTDDIYGEWSEPIVVDQDGIDPSLYFEGGRTFFISNGTDDYGESGVIQSEINIETGEKLTPSKCIWKGSGGRFLESPHMYKINGEYYLMAAEGGTEYGHMITYARGKDIWGPFNGYPKNPVVTNRNTAPEIIQGIGHGDLIQDKYGDWHILSLGFRQIHIWQAYHTLGREVFLYPVEFGEDGWFSAGTNGVVRAEYEMKGDHVQQEKKVYTFENTDWNIDWAYLRHPVPENYEQADDNLILHGTDVTLDDVDTPTFMALRQREFCFELTCTVSIDCGEAGATVFACENEHFDVAVCKGDTGYEGILKYNVGPAKHLQKSVPLSSDTATVIVRGENCRYSFYIADNGEEIFLGSADAKYVSTEVAGGFTGVMLGLYAVGNNTAKFTDFQVKYE